MPEATASDTFADQLGMPLEVANFENSRVCQVLAILSERLDVGSQFWEVTVFSADVHLSPQPFQTHADPRGHARD